MKVNGLLRLKLCACSERGLSDDQIISGNVSLAVAGSVFGINIELVSPGSISAPNISPHHVYGGPAIIDGFFVTVISALY